MERTKKKIDMDYEKKYKEALKDMRAIYPNLKGDAKLAVEHAFPELRESEDERIRKALIDEIKVWDEDYKLFKHVSKEKALAYLEKLKEPIDPFDTKLFQDGVKEGRRLEREDIKKEQKPAEWSKEDNIGWDEAFACVTRAEKAAKNEEELQNAVTAEKWLKEIKFKYYVHPVKKEWSEEDEYYMDAIITIINRETALYPKGGGTESFNNDLIDWLKSRRPSWKPSEVCYGAKGDPDPAGVWKPSEEQMRVLKQVEDRVAIKSGYWEQVLDSLYLDLIKL